jgi:hypothetical protein
MQSQRLSSRLGAILSLFGGALVIYGVFFLPMVFGSAGPASEWLVVNDSSQVAVVLFALFLLLVLFVLGTSAASFFRELSPGIVTWRRIAAIAGLIMQGPLGLFMSFFYVFGLPHFGAGYWLALLGCVIMIVGTFLN